MNVDKIINKVLLCSICVSICMGLVILPLNLRHWFLGSLAVLIICIGASFQIALQARRKESPARYFYTSKVSAFFLAGAVTMVLLIGIICTAYLIKVL